LGKCKKVTGLVIETRFETNRNAHILIRLDKDQEKSLYPLDYEKQNGYLVVEPVCSTLIDGKNPENECNGFINNIYLSRDSRILTGNGLIFVQSSFLVKDFGSVMCVTRSICSIAVMFIQAVIWINFLKIFCKKER
jgi:hypothetical protein